MEDYTTGTGQEIKVHDASRCAGEYCPIHNPSDHSMNTCPTNWRSDRGFMERVCPHGVGYPDPDDVKVIALVSVVYGICSKCGIIKGNV